MSPADEARRIFSPHEAQFPQHLRHLAFKLIELGISTGISSTTRIAETDLEGLGRRSGATIGADETCR